MVIQGRYGEQITEHLARNFPSEWSLKTLRLPTGLPQLLEEPSRLVAPFFPPTDLLILLGDEPAVGQALPYLAASTRAKAVIAPINKPEAFPSGLRRAVARRLSEFGVDAVFPKPFCSLQPNTGCPPIDRFARLFGRPEVEVSHTNGQVTGVRVVRGAPCGSTHFVAQRIVGTPLSDAPRKAGLLTQLYPCLASRRPDPELGVPLIHLAAQITASCFAGLVEGCDGCGRAPSGP